MVSASLLHNDNDKKTAYDNDKKMTHYHMLFTLLVEVGGELSGSKQEFQHKLFTLLV